MRGKSQAISQQVITCGRCDGVLQENVMGFHPKHGQGPRGLHRGGDTEDGFEQQIRSGSGVEADKMWQKRKRQPQWQKSLLKNLCHV